MQFNNFYSFKWPQLYFLWLLLYISIGYFTHVIITTDTLYYSSFINELSFERINDIIHINNTIQWIGLAELPILLFIKLGIIAGIIYSGMFVFNQNVGYKDCFKIVLLAELVPISVALIKLIYFIASPPSNINDIQSFYPLSLSTLFTNHKIPSYFLYPVQQLNIFEIIYWAFIAGGISVFTNKSFGYSFKIVALSYGPALGLWILCVMFIQLQLIS